MGIAATLAGPVEAIGERKRNSAALRALAGNKDTRKLLGAAGAERVCLFPDNGLVAEMLAKSSAERMARNEVVLHWSGRIEPRKALPLALEAISEAVKQASMDIRLEVSG